MIKNIIFDLDNTIILDKLEDADFYKESLKKLGYDENDYLGIFEAVDLYEANLTDDNPYFNKEEMLDFINKKMNRNYDMKLIDELNDAVGKYWTKRVMIEEEVLKDLSKKYNLYVFTNFFTEPQEQRLVEIGYRQYFKEVLGADKFGSKPFKKSIERVLDHINSKPEECIMVGDSIGKDILVANLVNMKSILFNYDGKRDNKKLNLKDYKVIYSCNHLVEAIENS